MQHRGRSACARRRSALPPVALRHEAAPDRRVQASPVACLRETLEFGFPQSLAGGAPLRCELLDAKHEVARRPVGNATEATPAALRKLRLVMCAPFMPDSLQCVAGRKQDV